MSFHQEVLCKQSAVMLQKQNSDVVNMTEAEARSAQAVIQQRQGNLGAGKPLTTGAFSSLKV